jgi:hypothetical protein
MVLTINGVKIKQFKALPTLYEIHERLRYCEYNHIFHSDAVFTCASILLKKKNHK